MGDKFRLATLYGEDPLPILRMTDYEKGLG
jgi:hypothetical protein